MKRARIENGFTLIEVLVVVTILGVLAAVVVFAVRGVGDKGSGAVGGSDVSTIRTAEESYCAKFGHYATAAQLVHPEDGGAGFLSQLPTLDAVTTTANGSCGPSSAPNSGYDILGVGTGNVGVDYAGSLVGLLGDPSQSVANRLGTTWAPITGFTFQGTGAGSATLASRIRTGVGAGATPDVFVSADPTQNSQAGGKVTWWVNFATTQIVIGWNTNSAFASDFQQAATAGPLTWEQVVEETTPVTGPQAGIAQPNRPRVGRTDPDLDPKGYRGCWAFQLDEARTGNAGFTNRILGDCHTAAGATNPNVVTPETNLIADMKAALTAPNAVDVGIFYKIEATEASPPVSAAPGVPFITLPNAVNLGDSAINYATEFGSAATPYTQTISPFASFAPAQIVYTITIPTTVTNPKGALSFVSYLLDGKIAQTIMNNDGLEPSIHRVGGDPNQVPASIKPFTQ